MFNYSKQQQELLFKLIYSGNINTGFLPEMLYKTIGKELDEGVLDGFGVPSKGGVYNIPDDVLLRELRENTWIFSGAKTYQEVKELGLLMVKDGEVLPFSEYKKLAKQKFDLYNQTYLETEHNFAFGQSQNARKWEEMVANSEFMPLARYRTVEDANVSEECAALDGVVMPIKSTYWNTRSPKNHFNCRCILEQGDENDFPVTKNPPNPKIDDLFSYNPGVDRIIFKPEHPYFQVDPKDKEFAKRNFDLPIPKL